MKGESIILGKSKKFALRIIKLYTYLRDKKRVFVISKQILRCGTSIGANVKESTMAQSRPDFYSKLHIALKEAAETEYWLELLHESGFLEKKYFDSIYIDCQEILKILTAIIITKQPIKTNK
ncbi:MAG: four helix bundle protein [Bacteroidales bacterium]|jgi:four helix bundle protein|nr:four helix bundle protein [Bacteroidales bacterium]